MLFTSTPVDSGVHTSVHIAPSTGVDDQGRHMNTFAGLVASVLLAFLGYILGLLQRQPARRVAVPLSSRPVAPVATQPAELSL